MADRKLRQAIAAEAARLLQQRKEPDFHAARRKAARWFSRQRVSPADLPSFGEIQQEVFALAGLFSSERQQSALSEIRLVAHELLELLNDFEPWLTGSALTGPILPGAEIELILTQGDLSDLSAVLFDAGHRSQLRADGSLTFFDRYACVVSLVHELPTDDLSRQPPRINLQGLDELLAEESERDLRRMEALDQELDDSEESGTDDYHPDFFPTLEMLLNSLESIRLDPVLHPEGDLLYHTMQVYELGLAELPYDEEFLLACLLHDIGVGLDRRRPLEAAWQAIGELVTPRTWFLIENRAEAVEYLSTGRIRGTLKRSEDFEELVLLAKCDLKGRICGAHVSSVEDALEYIAGLSSAWDSP
ncbi:MAG: hypothetical protein V4719_14525 [Planctomycetota bacterium]